MIHGNIPNNFAKLVQETARQLRGETLLQLATIMGPEDVPNRLSLNSKVGAFR